MPLALDFCTWPPDLASMDIFGQIETQGTLKHILGTNLVIFKYVTFWWLEGHLSLVLGGQKLGCCDQVLVFLTAKEEVCSSSPASYLCWNAHGATILTIYTGIGATPDMYWPYTLANVSHQRWNLGSIYHVYLCQVQISLPALTLKPSGDITSSLKQGY